MKNQRHAWHGVFNLCPNSITAFSLRGRTIKTEKAATSWRATRAIAEFPWVKKFTSPNSLVIGEWQ